MFFTEADPPARRHKKNKKKNKGGHKKHDDDMDEEAGYYSKDPPTIDWIAVQGVVITVSVLFIVLSVLLLTLFVYSNSGTTHMFTGYMGDFARATRTFTNATDRFTKALPAFNLTNIMNKTVPQNDDEWVDVTQRIQRSADDLLVIVADIKEANLIKSVSALAYSIYDMIRRPNFGNILDALETGVPMIMEVAKQPETKEFLGHVSKLIGKFSDILTEDRVDRLLNVMDEDDFKDLLVQGISFIKEGTKATKSANVILEKTIDIVEVVEEEYDAVLIESVKHITIYGSQLVGQVVNASIVISGGEILHKFDDSLRKEEIAIAYTRLVDTVGHLNDIMADMKKNNMVSHTLELYEKMERMEEMMEAVLYPFQRGMTLYKEQTEANERRETNVGQITRKSIQHQ